MSNIGGYQIVDLKNTPITAGGSAVTVPGVYDKIEGTRKRIVISGLVIGSTEYPDVTVSPVVSSGDYVFTAFGYVLTVTADDEVTAVASTVPVGGYTAGTGIAIEDGVISLAE